MESPNYGSYERFLRSEPTDEKVIRGLGYLCIDTVLDKTNPFVSNEYDFQDGFYQGEFTFESPLHGGEISSTPETYGRHRVVSSLLDLVGERNVSVLDLGAGTLDIARTIPLTARKQFTVLNSDISGPWSSRGRSSMERGSDEISGFNDMYNIQYDFNISEWPFNPASIDYIVSNMALHHMKPELKRPLLKSMHDSLGAGGRVIFTDVFQKDETGVRFTQAGLRGPEECGGYLTAVSEFITTAHEIGFSSDKNSNKLDKEGRNYQKKEELDLAAQDIHSTMAINKAIWFMELRK